MKNVTGFIRKHPYCLSTLAIVLVGMIFIYAVSCQYDQLLSFIASLTNGKDTIKGLEQLTKSSLIYSIVLIITLLLILLAVFLHIIHILLKKKKEKNAENEVGTAGLLKELNEVKNQLLIQDRLASVGMLTGGIAHEIKNPLNFINNFSEMGTDLLDELKEELKSINLPENQTEGVKDVIQDLEDNLEKINQHGKRAESIVKHILMQAHTEDLTKIDTNINDLVDEYLHLAYHGMRAQDPDFNISIKTDYEKDLPLIKIAQQNIGRVFLNIINNGLYAAYDKKSTAGADFMPTIEVHTKRVDNNIEIIIKDNGVGIPDSVRKRIFEPFFTTKPIGVGTGLGLHICHDIIVKQHGGLIDIDTKKWEYTAFIIKLPIEPKKEKEEKKEQ